MKRYQLIPWMLGNVHTAIKKERLAQRLREVTDLETAWNIFRDFPNFGGSGFLSFQIIWDLTYSETFWSERVRTAQFPYVGPGCAPGLQALFLPDEPRTKYPGGQERKWTNLLQKLHSEQADYLSEDFPRLSLWDCEHMMCDLRKYLDIKEGHSAGRNFTPHHEEDPI